MAGNNLLVAERGHHPERDFSAVIAGAEVPKEIDKKFFSLKAAEGDGSLADSLFTPTTEQLEKINLFTRSPKTAEQVICFNTLSCNDMIDRSTDRFREDCIRDFATLPEPYSSVGKSFLVAHDTKKLPVGRIFDVGLKEVEANDEDVLFLTNSVYLPNTEANKSYIENLDYGIFWAVSVGVVLGKSECTVCNEPFSGWGYWCINGHDKGEYYDPDSEETDAWGWPLPCDADDKKAVFCVRELFQPKDYYELSQVYLGAQFFAGLDKQPMLGGLIKAASAGKIGPIINITEKEAAALPIPTDEKLFDAFRNFKTQEEADGSIKWTDNQGLVWIYSVDEEQGGKVLCLGKEAEEEPEEEEPASTTDEGDPEGSETATAVDVQVVNLNPATSTQMTRSVTINGEPMENLFDTRVIDLEKQVEELKPKAEIADNYLSELRSDVVHWYVVSRRDFRKTATENQAGVDTSVVERLLDQLGDNVELLKQLRDDYRDQAQSHFPAAIRRSSAEVDPHERTMVDTDNLNKHEKESEEKVRKIHD